MENQNVAIEIKKLANCIARSFNGMSQGVDCHNISGQQIVIISYLKDNMEHEIFQKDIEKQFNIRRSSVTNILQSLEHNHLIKRESVSSDARLKKIVLTKNALDIVKKTEKQVHLIENKMLKGLDQKEIDHLLTIINTMKDNLLEE